MGAETFIRWCDGTSNPWQGCTHVSPGCDHCYMHAWQDRLHLPRAVKRSSDATFSAPLKWKPPQRIFTCSLSDFFLQAADPWRDDYWQMIRETPRHTYMILTKRPQLVPDRLPTDWGAGYPNVWLGVSVENQAMADNRIPCLQALPAVRRFLSIEPLLEPLPALDLTGISWVIVGGESGSGFRPMPHEWVWPIRDACSLAGIAFFFKQSASRRQGAGAALRHEDGTSWTHHEWPDERHAPVCVPPPTETPRGRRAAQGARMHGATTT